MGMHDISSASKIEIPWLCCSDLLGILLFLCEGKALYSAWQLKWIRVPHMDIRTRPGSGRRSRKHKDSVGTSCRISCSSWFAALVCSRGWSAVSGRRGSLFSW
ncbi:uncharacterized protein [Pseudochaenichthys georgianus]|uniref:uncharacterized protein isoform X2 n=1 Tax=Pseudochaenichthys georgianus TaxID=52239 RepID=UPI0039C375F8